MSGLRTALGIVASSALAAGYAASQWAVVTRSTAEYSAAVDRPVVQAIALVTLAAATALAFWKDGESRTCDR